MNQIWIVVVVLVGLVIFTRLRNRRSSRVKAVPNLGPKISGFQVVTYMHPRMSAACLFDHGVQFGKGFRRKEGPTIPHGGSCKCEAIPFSFSSSEVFNGALRGIGELKGDVPGSPPEEMEDLIARMREAESRPVDRNREAYLAAVGLNSVAKHLRPEWERFLSERHAFILEEFGEQEDSGGTAGEPETASKPPEQRMES